eukprot:SAG11_NODE_14364_length_614_cov_12.407767_2_plen_60_part_00
MILRIYGSACDFGAFGPKIGLSSKNANVRMCDHDIYESVIKSCADRECIVLKLRNPQLR